MEENIVDITSEVEQVITDLELQWGLREGDSKIADGSVVSYESVVRTLNELLPIQITPNSSNTVIEDERSTDPCQSIDGSVDQIQQCLKTHGPWQTTPTHKDLFESRKRRLGEFGNLWRQMTILAENSEADDADKHFDIRVHIDEDTKMRISRLLEILYTAEQTQIGLRQLQYLLSTGIESIRNIPNSTSSVEMFGKRFKRDLTPAKKTPYLELCTSMLQKLCRNGYRRYRGNVMASITYNGHYTFAWKVVCTIDDFVWRNIDKDINADDFENAMANKGNITSCIDFLKNCHDFQFEDLKKDRRIHAFRNAVYITSVRDESDNHLKESHISYFKNPTSETLLRMTRNGEVACAFHDCYFPEDSASCPALNKIMDHQQWSEEVKEWAMAFIGRMLHPISSIPSKVALDSWQVIVMWLGLGNCGKSTIVDNVVFLFFDPEDIVYIQNNLEKQYGWAKCKGRYMWLAPEIKADFANHTDQAQWQVVVEGGRLATARKYAIEAEQFDPFDLSGMMAGNENIEFHDNGDSVSRRRVDFYFGNPVTNVDPQMSYKLAQQLGHIMYLCNESYLRKTNEVQSRIWNYLPTYFVEMRKENAAQTNALEHFLMHGSLEYGSASNGYYVHQADFSKLYIQHCKDNELQNRKSLKKDYFAGPFSKRNIVVQKSILKDPFTFQERNGYWFEGVKYVSAS